MEASAVVLPMSVTLKMAAGDLVLMSNGQFQQASGLEKSNQDLAEALLNNYDPLDPPWYPTGSEFYVIDDNVYAYNQMGMETVIRSMAESAIERLMEAQADDPYVDDEELIVETKSVDVWAVGDLSFAFYAACVTDSDENVDVSFDIDLSHQLPSEIETSGGGTPGTGTPL